MLSEDDAHWLTLLQPASRSELPGWLEAHDRLAGEVDAVKAAGVSPFMTWRRMLWGLSQAWDRQRGACIPGLAH